MSSAKPDRERGAALLVPGNGARRACGERKAGADGDSRVSKSVSHFHNDSPLPTLSPSGGAMERGGRSKADRSYASEVAG